MAVTVQQEVAALYSAIFSRAPDQAGLQFWVNAIEGGSSLAQAAEGFTAHPVFAETYAGLTNIQFVQQLYVNVLGSAGDAQGIQFWANKLASGVTQGQMVAEFVQGALTIDLDALLASGELSQAEFDAAVVRQDSLTNKATVGVYFAETFGAASNLNPATDTTTAAGLAADPAYVASQAAIANVNNNLASVTAAQARIDVAVTTDNPAGSLVGQNSALTAALVELTNAQKAVSDFLEANELADAAAVTAAVTDAQNDLDAEVGGTNVTVSVANGYLADRQAAVVSAQNAVATAQKGVNDTPGAAAAIAARDATAAAKVTADDAALAAKAGAAAAETNFSVLNNDATVSYTDGQAVTPGANASVVTVGTDTVIAFDAAGQNLVIVSGAETLPGINNLLAAVKADQAAVAAAAKADANATDAAAAITGPIKAADDNLTAAKGNLTTANEAVTELQEAITALQAAVKVQSDYNLLADAVESALDAFDDLEVNLAGSTGTAGDDLFLASAFGNNDTITGFGAAGDDVLFVGLEYKAGAGDFLKNEGDVNALEVFFTQNGANAEVHIETAPFGSNAANQADVTTIVLTGVDASTLVFENGFVSVA